MWWVSQEPPKVPLRDTGNPPRPGDLRSLDLPVPTLLHPQPGRGPRRAGSSGRARRGRKGAAGQRGARQGSLLDRRPRGLAASRNDLTVNGGGLPERRSGSPQNQFARAGMERKKSARCYSLLSRGPLVNRLCAEAPQGEEASCALGSYAKQAAKRKLGL
nr:thyroid hormone-inducible hepatic protein isoform X1 [Microcebus murinus]